MSKEKKLIPVSQLPSPADFDPEIDPITWDFSLPPTIDAERIVFDMRALSRVQKVAAFSSNHIREYIGDQTQHETSVLGINADGSAVGGKTKLSKKAESSQSVLVDDAIGEFGTGLMKNYFKTAAIHGLNKSEIVSRVVDMVRDDGATREQAWAHELNGALKASVNQAASRHLLQRESKRNKVLHTLGVTTGVSFILSGIARSDPAMIIGNSGVVAMMWGVVVIIHSAENKLLHGESLLSERRWTGNLYGGWQPDRYAATLALTSMMPLVRYRK